MTNVTKYINKKYKTILICNIICYNKIIKLRGVVIVPFINTKVNFEVSKEKEVNVKDRLGKAISIIPGKSERSLMLGFEKASMYFHGEECDKLAMVEVKLFGTADRGAMNSLTGELCKIYNEEFGIPQGNIYVKYEEVEVWGCNGSNF